MIVGGDDAGKLAQDAVDGSSWHANTPSLTESVRAFPGHVGRGSDLANREEHGDGLRSIAEGATDQLNRFEAQGRVEGDRIGFRIHYNADTADAVPHLQREFEGGAQQQPSDAMPLESAVHGQSGKPQDGQGVSGEASTQALGQLLRDHLPAGYGNETYDLVLLDSDIRRSDMVSELILASVALEKAIEIDVAASKVGSVVPRLQSPDANPWRRISHGTRFSELQKADLPA